MINIISVQFDQGLESYLNKTIEINLREVMSGKGTLEMIQGSFLCKVPEDPCIVEKLRWSMFIDKVSKLPLGSRVLLVSSDVVLTKDISNVFSYYAYDMIHTDGVLFITVSEDTISLLYRLEDTSIEDLRKDNKILCLDPEELGLLRLKAFEKESLINFLAGSQYTCTQTIDKWISLYEKIEEESFIYFVVVYFDYEGKVTYTTLAKVLEHSIIKNVPLSRIISKGLTVPIESSVSRSRSFLSNTIKLEHWIEILDSLPYGSQLVFIDADTLVIKDIREVFNKDFDVAYTKRTSSSFPINGGVLFIKKTERSMQFLREWKIVNDTMFHDKTFHEHWRKKYAGINQAAFGYLLEKYKEPIDLLEVPCAIYNACNEDWRDLNPDCRIVHIKGPFRKVLFEQQKNPDFTQFGEAFYTWKELYNESC